jgi:uncharacterized protein (DUF433 family)
LYLFSSTHVYALCWKIKQIVIKPEILGGEPVFAGTRVPVRRLFDHLEGGKTIKE